MSCKYGGGWGWEHNSILNVWSECLTNLHLHQQMEPRHRYVNSDDCPDILIYDSETEQNIEVDISLAHPWSQDVIKGASKENGYAAAKREKRKRAKYAGEQVPGGSRPASLTVSLLFLNNLVHGVQPKLFLLSLKTVKGC